MNKRILGTIAAGLAVGTMVIAPHVGADPDPAPAPTYIPYPKEAGPPPGVTWTPSPDTAGIHSAAVGFPRTVNG